jgi:hypothetical protein
LRPDVPIHSPTDHDRREPQESACQPLIREADAADEEIGAADDVGPDESRQGSADRGGRSLGRWPAGWEGSPGLREPARRRRDRRRAGDEWEQPAERLAELEVGDEHGLEVGTERVSRVERPRWQAAAVGSTEEVDESQAPALRLGGRADPRAGKEVDRPLDLEKELGVANRTVGIRRRCNESLQLPGDAVEDGEPKDPDHHARRVVEARADFGQPRSQGRIGRVHVDSLAQGRGHVPR